MPGEPLVRTFYRDPTIGEPAADPGPVRSGNAGYSDVNTDIEQYHQPRERIHGSGPHSYGVAGGFGVTITGQKQITVQPGVAIDASGRHISLGVGGQAGLGLKTIQVKDPASGQLIDVQVPASLIKCNSAAGVACDTTGQTDGVFVTVRWWESFDYASLNGPIPVYNIDDTPLIQFQAPGSFTADGNNGIILARLSLDNAGNVTGLTEDQRFTAGIRAGVIRIQRGYTDASGAIGDTVSAGLDPLPPGGLDISVPGPGDEIHLRAADGNFANLDVSATRITARHPDGTPSVAFETDSATAHLGMEGQAGHVDVRGPNDQYSVFLDGDLGLIIAGGQGLSGATLLIDANSNETIYLDAGAGDLWYTGSLQDPNFTHPPVTHDDLRQLTTGVLTNLHQHHTSDASTPIFLWMFCNKFGSDVQTISWGSQANVFASVTITSIDVTGGGFDSDDALFAEIYRIDGNDPGGVFFETPPGPKLGPQGDDRNLRVPAVETSAQSITFRLRSTDDCAFWALAVVYVQP